MSQFGATILDADGLRLTKDEIAFFKEADPYGFILFARNIDSADQVYGLCDEMRSALGRDAPILIDQEGGRVQRMRGPIWREWTPPMDCVEAARDEAERAMYLRYRIIASELKAVGVDVNCAPMADLARPETHPFLKNRCYGAGADTVVPVAKAVAAGLMDGGVLPVLKHIPGHGRSEIDSHDDLPIVRAEAEELDEDFAAFAPLNDIHLGMTAHLVYEAFDEAPATLSETMIDLVRTKIGFDGLLMTDDIGMKALKGTPAQITQAALAAGCDVVLSCNASLLDREACANAAGLMNDAAQARAEAALAARQAPDDVDISDLSAEFEALVGGRVNGG